MRGMQVPVGLQQTRTLPDGFLRSSLMPGEECRDTELLRRVLRSCQLCCCWRRRRRRRSCRRRFVALCDGRRKLYGADLSESARAGIHLPPRQVLVHHSLLVQTGYDFVELSAYNARQTILNGGRLTTTMHRPRNSIISDNSLMTIIVISLFVGLLK